MESSYLKGRMVSFCKFTLLLYLEESDLAAAWPVDRRREDAGLFQRED